MFSLSELQDIRDKITESTYKETTKLICQSCKKIRTVTKAEFSEYLKRGWPECCGRTMQLKH